MVGWDRSESLHGKNNRDRTPGGHQDRRAEQRERHLLEGANRGPGGSSGRGTGRNPAEGAWVESSPGVSQDLKSVPGPQRQSDLGRAVCGNSGERKLMAGWRI